MSRQPATITRHTTTCNIQQLSSSTTSTASNIPMTYSTSPSRVTLLTMPHQPHSRVMTESKFTTAPPSYAEVMGNDTKQNVAATPAASVIPMPPHVSTSTLTSSFPSYYTAISIQRAVKRVFGSDP